MKKLIQRVLFMLMSVVFITNSSAGIVFADNEQTVRVGIFSLGKFQYKDENGKALGYNIEYLNEIAKKTHWNYEYVDCENWIDATTKLEKKEIDLLAPAQITEALSAKFDYAALYMGTEAAAIYTKSSNTMLYEDFENMNNIKYGCAENSTFAKKFVAEYCPDHNMNPQIQYYANTTELQDALANREVDAIVTNIMFASDEYKLLGWFSLLPVYYITQKGNRDLLTKIDNAMNKILAEDPSFGANLEAKYFPILNDGRLTYEERAFIKTLPELTVGYETNHAPLSYMDEKTGEFSGISRDILDKISQISGIRFKYEPLPTSDISFEYLKKNDIFLVSNMDYSNKNHDKLLMSIPYLKSERIMVAKAETTFESDGHYKIAIPSGTESLQKEISTNSNFEFEIYPTTDECCEAVKKGETDGMILNRYVSGSTLENPSYSKLKVKPMQTIDNELCLAAVNINDNSTLAKIVNDEKFMSVIDKAIPQISQNEINQIIIKNTSDFRYQYGILDFLKKYWFLCMLFLILIGICFFLMLRARNIETMKNHTLALKNKQLGEAVNQAERANVAKSQFLSRMSHEIRTPMNAIVGLTEISKTHLNEPNKMKDYLSKIDSSSRVLLNIINDVLDMSAIESDKLKIASQEFDLKQILNEISNIYYSQCKNKNITFNMGTDITDEMLIGDALRVNQILMNLVSNAYKFTEPGGTISITANQTEKKNKNVFIRFKVSDNGCGMTEEMQQRLFKPFEQESATTAQKTGGSGLGLSIAKNLVDMMHGAISVKSKKGEGTTFTVDIPFGTTEHSTGVQPEQLKNMKVLVVDDDKGSLKYTGIVLERIGIKYDTVSDGHEALKMLEEQHKSGKDYDICFVDWKMPGLNGVELTKKIRDNISKDVTVIIVSAYDTSEVMDEAKSAGADMFVSKPLFQSTVFNILVQLTGGVVNKTTEHAADHYDFKGSKLLLAEDNELNAEIATDLLEMVNAEVERAVNGEDAVKKFVESKPGTYDIILMDIQMPIMDGYQATEKIRGSQHPQASNIPIFAMTANAFTEDVSKSLSSGMNGHIAKPINTAILYETINRTLKQLKG